MRTIAPRLPGPEYMAGEEQLDATPTCFQIAKDGAGRPCVVTRWTFSDEERARIACGDDLFVLSYLDDRPLPDMAMLVGLPQPTKDHT